VDEFAPLLSVLLTFVAAMSTIQMVIEESSDQTQVKRRSERGMLVCNVVVLGTRPPPPGAMAKAKSFTSSPSPTSSSVSNSPAVKKFTTMSRSSGVMMAPVLLCVLGTLTSAQADALTGPAGGADTEDNAKKVFTRGEMTYYFPHAITWLPLDQPPPQPLIILGARNHFR
jgi:hypothetical protein